MEEITQALSDTSIEQFRTVYLREHTTTRKLLTAFPPEQSELKPHERSSSARTLAWTFVLEEAMMLKTLNNESILGSGFGKAPESWHAVLEVLDEQHGRIMEKLQSVDTASLQAVKFFVAPKQTADYAPMSFLWFLLFDQIHHRGQLSVMLRMAGGKVPSIYGPSADEPFF